MKKKEALLGRLSRTILDGEAEQAARAARDVLDAGLDPVEILNSTIAQAAAEVGDKFERGEYFTPHLVLAGNAIEKATKVLQEGVSKGELEEKKVVVIGTVQGDLHSLGKDIVALMLRAVGFEVHDLGVDVSTSTFIQRAQEVNADVIGLSCLMTTTLPYQREVLEDLEIQGLRDRFRVMMGGGAVTEAWVEEIGADGYAYDIPEVVKLTKDLTGLAAQRS